LSVPRKIGGTDKKELYHKMCSELSSSKPISFVAADTSAFFAVIGFIEIYAQRVVDTLK